MTGRTRNLQSIAANPAFNVWVSASAGSGKTTILSKRLLRLMLPEGNRLGCRPEKLLCLTFTKTGAGEMKQKLMQTLKKWAIAPDAALIHELTLIIESPPTVQQIQAARSLFGHVIESPGGLKIMTIHAFCLSVLQRFPIESGLAPGFTVLETQELEIMHQKAFDQTVKSHGHLLPALLQTMAPKTLQDTVQKFVLNHDKWAAKVAQFDSVQAMCLRVYDLFGLEEGVDSHSLAKSCFGPFLDDSFLARLPSVLQRNLKKDAKEVPAFVDSIGLARMEDEPYKRANCLIDTGLTQKHTVRLSIKKILQQDMPDTADEFCLALETYALSSIRLRQAQSLKALLEFTHVVLENVTQQKLALGKLDNTDLVIRTAHVLNTTHADWIQYKLDSSIDHILVDEAQDTSPSQWAIINALANPFFDTHAADDEKKRSFFVVGDDKQSIFSFQGAAPHLFKQLEQITKHTVEQAGYAFKSVPLQTSFRSAQLVLDLVDAVFASNPAKTGVVGQEQVLKHDAFHETMSGEIELWPVFEAVEKTSDETDIEDPAHHYTIRSKIDAEENLAECIVSEISHWLTQKITLPGTQRSIMPDDILILVRRRGKIAGRLVRLLKQNNIPVEGMDRLILGQMLAVQDVCAALKFALQPSDDLSLAAVLRSPFVDLDEQQLFEICHGRADKCSVFTALPQGAVKAWLTQLIAVAGTGSASQFVSFILDIPCPQSPVSGLEALIARLGADALDPLLLFLDQAHAFSAQAQGGLHAFLTQIEQDKTEIKREQDKAKGMVRVMTVHGSKGLEAPIVILPDTLRRKTDETDTRDRLMWPEDNLPPYIKVPKEISTPKLASQSDTLHKLQEDEYNRLLYVALTRASHKLIVCGAWTNKKERPAEHCWYHAVKLGVNTLLASKRYTGLTEKFTPFNPHVLAEDAVKIRLTDIKAKAKADIAPVTPDVVLKPAPVWLHQPALPAPVLVKPLAPSKSAHAEPSVLSPLLGGQENRYKRGLLLHSLLQYLPGLDAIAHQPAAQAYLEQTDLTAPQQQEVVKTALAVLAMPELQALFGTGSKAEVPITGQVGNHIVSGQIDRLVVTQTDVYVLDYKTNRPAPPDPPLAYIEQMQLYRALLTQIYPQHCIHTYLLWTDGPRLQIIP